jgi:hypothetical protein
MILLELISKPSLPDDMEDKVQNPKDDKSVPSLSSVRKSRLTLAQINKLRMMTDVRRYEERERLERIKDQYAPPSDEAPAM